MKILSIFILSTFLYSCNESNLVDPKTNEINANQDTTDSIPKCSKALLSDFRSIQMQCRVTHTQAEREHCIQLVDEFNEIYPPYFECKAVDKSGIEDKIVILSTEKMMLIREQLERRDIP